MAKSVKKKVSKAVTKSRAELVKQEKKAKQKLATAKKKFVAAEKKIHSVLKKHPERAVLVATALGAAIGAAVTAGMKHKKRR